MRFIIILLIGIAIVGCKSQVPFNKKCYWWSSNEKDLIEVKKKVVKKHLPLISNINEKEYAGKIITCSYDTLNEVYILELNNMKNKGESYCIKASNTWKVDSVITSLLPLY